MEEIVVFSIFGSYNVGKYSYLNYFLRDNKPKDLINRPLKWLLTFPFDNEEDTLIISVYPDRVLETTQGVIVMFDVTDRFSYDESLNTIQQIIAHYPLMPILWLGNKVDAKPRRVTKTEAVSFKKKLKRGRMLLYRDLSVLKGKNVNRSLSLLLREACSMDVIEDITENVESMSLD